MKTVTLHLMKKALLLLGILTLTNLAKGQEIVTEFWHENGNYYGDINMVETTDKCMIVASIMGAEYSPDVPPIGIMFYKFSADGMVRDSLLIYDSSIGVYPLPLFERDPEHPDRFVYASFVPTDDTLFFRMRTIDMNLDFIGDTILEIDHFTELFSNNSYDLFAEPNGDIIASYSIKDDPNETFMTWFLRIGFNGTLKSRTEVPAIRYFDNLHEKHTGMYNESPVQYCYWGCNHDANSGDNPPIRLYVLDSLFNVVEEQCFYFYQGHFYTKNWNDQFVSIDDQYYLQVNKCSQFDPQTYYSTEWILLEKRNRRHVKQATAIFGDSNQYRQPEAIRAIAVNSNTIYLSYMTTVVANNHLVLLRLDGDLNVQWERHFLSEDTFHFGRCMRVLDNGNIAVASFSATDSPNSVSVVVVKDDYEDLEELGIQVRPYTYYPNPVQSELHLHYSPDVQPDRIELFDLRGQLLQTQSQNFECVSLEGFAAGRYLMKITMKDGKAFTDKVVKE